MDEHLVQVVERCCDQTGREPTRAKAEHFLEALEVQNGRGPPIRQNPKRQWAENFIGDGLDGQAPRACVQVGSRHPDHARDPGAHKRRSEPGLEVEAARQTRRLTYL